MTKTPKTDIFLRLAALNAIILIIIEAWGMWMPQGFARLMYPDEAVSNLIMRHIFSLAVWVAILVVGGMLIRKATYYLLITVPFILYFCTTVFYAGSGFFAHNQSFYTGAHLMGIFQLSIAVLVVLAAVFYWQETGGKKPSA